jgi:Carboxypeptidase regulatory-like domain
MRSLALLAGLVVPCVLVAQGAADGHGISGYVLAPGDVPVSGGTVASVSLASNSSTAIDRSGRFRIPVERAGVFRVTVNVPGLTPYHFSVTVPASRTLRLVRQHGSW